jgi:CRP-like cAMP-binding protein
MQETEEYKARMSFLLTSLPGLQKCSRIIRDRICRSFREHSYPAGHTLFKEGEFIKSGYVIRQGEIELYSRRNLRLIGYINQLREEKKMD